MDPALIKKAVSGDREALTRLVDAYKDIAFNLAFSIVGDKEDALDVTQESFLKVLENIAGFRNEAKFTTWLYRIVYNEAVQFNRKNKRELFTGFESIKDYVENSNEEAKDYFFLHHAISKLEKNEQNIIILFYLAEKPVKEIKQITGKSVSNIKVILHRARKKLHEKLELQYEDVG
ncbi:MAG: sigma-70 family RNA polymerase sigma factor [Prolixibacteraceae bacterium]|nr:sigma-70 family RNA polymerase sigma factor [Prolixibacteraceae bacterium]MBN2773364.1 sigma-70 family RNA polymerase sigma factor [Prolixibacteraceae bacterium]